MNIQAPTSNLQRMFKRRARKVGALSIGASLELGAWSLDVPKAICILSAALLIGGCTVGPNFTKPAPPNVSRYTPNPLPAQTTATPAVTAGQSQHFVEGLDIPSQWWTVFHSKP